MFNRAAYENSRPDGFGVLEIGGEPERGEGGPRLFVPLKRSELTGEIAGPLASLHLTQVFGYTKEQMDKVLEAVYRFPLPGDVAVTGVRVQFGDVEILAELKEREEAKEEYEKAKKEGRQAALTTRESADVFTLHVAGIQPDEDVTVETSYVQLGHAEEDGWSLRVPLTTAPRYVRSDEATSSHAQGQPLLLLRDPGHRFALDLTFLRTGPISSDTHEIEVTEDGEVARVRLRDGEVLPDRDCLLTWCPPQESSRPALEVILHDDEDSGQVYFLALVAPPAEPSADLGVPREVILLVDHSGSMQGPKWEAADWAVEQFLLDLTPQDEFALCLFHNSPRWFAEKPRRADQKDVDEAIQFLLGHKDSGGTELGVALEQGLHLRRSTDERARHVVIVTDAQVTDAGRILRLADEEAAEKHRRRISVLCIDAAPNSFLASELAQRGGGLARFLTSSPDELDITTALDEVLKDWAQPILADLRLCLDQPGAQVAGRGIVTTKEKGWSCLDLGDMPRGRALWVAGRVPRDAAQKVGFRVATGSGKEIASSSVEVGKGTTFGPALKALFGSRRVLGLEYLGQSGYDLEEIEEQLVRLQYDPKIIPGKKGGRGKVYAENVREDALKALRSLLLREALEYGLASSETAFVAVRKEAGKPVEGTVPVANALPVGWSEDFLLIGGPAQYVARSSSVRTGLPPDLSAPSLMRASVVKSAGAATDARLASMGPAMAEARKPAEPTVVFLGIPELENGEAVLFDSSRKKDRDKLPGSGTIRGLQVKFPGGAVDAATLDPELKLLLFVGDLASPRAEARLADIVRRRGQRPLNLSRRKGDIVRIVLLDPSGAWSRSAPRMEVALA
jgi:Ca-activated chloride channel family protein